MAKRTSFKDWDCSIAQTADIIGEVWTPLIIRDLFWGIDKYESLLEDLGISRNILADRLKTLHRAGIVEKVVYEERPVRHRYRLTEKGIDLWSILVSMMAWGDKWTDAGRPSPPVRLEHRTCGQQFTPVTVCSTCGETLNAADVSLEFQRGEPAVLETAGR